MLKKLLFLVLPLPLALFYLNPRVVFYFIMSIPIEDNLQAILTSIQIINSFPKYLLRNFLSNCMLIEWRRNLNLFKKHFCFLIFDFLNLKPCCF